LMSSEIEGCELYVSNGKFFGSYACQVIWAGEGVTWM
jgi:hypothetical protein